MTNITEGRTRRKQNPRRRTLGTAVSDPEKDRLVRAFEQSRLGTGPSEVVRVILFAFERSAAVRDAVAEAVRQHGIAA